MQNATATLLFAFLLIFSSCKFSNQSSNHEESSHKKHWSYEGETAPEYWAEIEENSDCGGANQSPINIIEINAQPVPSVKNLEIMYSPKTILKQVNNNGHSIQFDFNQGDSIQYMESTYHLKQIHFHEPAEHFINGIKYPIEIHLVHQNSEGNITVLGILGAEGNESQLFEFFESFLPLKNGETKSIESELDLTTLFPKNKSYFSYQGSLTTPPCTENVNWIVFKDPIILSLEEVLKLKNNMPINNYRNEQPLNGRTVYYNFEPI